jgi:hypothetical protein
VMRTVFYNASYSETRTGDDPCVSLCGSAMTNDYCSCLEPGTDGNAWAVQRGACAN